MTIRRISLGVRAFSLLAFLAFGLVAVQPSHAQSANTELAAARKLFEAKKYSEALSGFSAIAGRYPNTTEASVAAYYLGLTQERMGRFSEALAAYNDMQSAYGKTEMARFARQRAKEIQDRLQSGPKETPTASPQPAPAPVKERKEKKTKPDELDRMLGADRSGAERTGAEKGVSFPERGGRAATPAPVAAGNRGSEFSGGKFPVRYLNPKGTGDVVPFDAGTAFSAPGAVAPASATPVVMPRATPATAPASSGSVQFQPVKSSSSSVIGTMPATVATATEWREVPGGDLGMLRPPTSSGNSAATAGFLTPPSGGEPEWVELSSVTGRADDFVSGLATGQSASELVSLALAGRPRAGNVPSPAQALGGMLPTKSIPEAPVDASVSVPRIDPSEFKIDVPDVKIAGYSGFEAAASPVADEPPSAAPASVAPPAKIDDSFERTAPGRRSGGTVTEKEIDEAVSRLGSEKSGIPVAGPPDWTPDELSTPAASPEPGSGADKGIGEFAPIAPEISGAGPASSPGPELGSLGSDFFSQAAPLAPQISTPSDLSGSLVSTDGTGASWSTAPAEPGNREFALPLSSGSSMVAPPSASSAAGPQAEIGMDDFRQELMREAALNAPPALPGTPAPLGAAPGFASPGLPASGPATAIPSFGLDGAASARRVSTAGSPADPYILRALDLRRSGRDDLAVAEYIKAVEIDPSNPIARNNLADLWLSRNERVDDAIALLTQAIALEPPDKGPYYSTLGLAYGMKGDHERAERFLTESIRLGSTAERHLRRGNLYAAMGLVAKARTDYERAMVYSEDAATTARIRTALSALEPAIPR